MAAANIDEYITGFPREVQEILQKIRDMISAKAPDATEAMTYGVPTFKLNGNLVHFAAFKGHIGFYPTPSGIEAFKNKLKDYKISTGTIKFPYNKPIPFNIIDEIIDFRIAEQRD